MNTRFLCGALFWLACSTVLAMPCAAETVNFKAELSGKNEVPPNATNGKGQITATYDTAAKKLTWNGEYSGLTGPAIMAHFHGPAGPGKNAPVVVPITSPQGSATVTAQQASQLLAGQWYVNVHTDAHKDGEIRGQLTPVK